MLWSWIRITTESSCVMCWMWQVSIQQRWECKDTTKLIQSDCGQSSFSHENSSILFNRQPWWTEPLHFRWSAEPSGKNDGHTRTKFTWDREDSAESEWVMCTPICNYLQERRTPLWLRKCFLGNGTYWGLVWANAHFTPCWWSSSLAGEKRQLVTAYEMEEAVCWPSAR